MFPNAWLAKGKCWLNGKSAQKAGKRYRGRRVPLRLEQLEDRCIPATLAVVNADDNVAEAHTLRWAVANAVSGDTILIAPDLKNTPIVLTQGELVLNQDVTIKGAGNAPETISGDGLSRVFEIGAGATVTLANLNLTNGDGFANNPDGAFFLDGAGGAILDFGNLTMDYCTLSGNSVGGVGGGVFILYGATLAVSGSSFAGNSAGDSGGAICNLGTLAVNNSTLTGNFAGSAAGIFNTFAGTATISNTIFSGNSALGYGGGMENDGMALVSGCTFSGNSVVIFNGGAIENGIGGMLTVQDCTLTANSAGFRGGAIANEAFANLTVSDSTLSGNSAVTGGGIFNDLFATATVTGSTLSGNSASFDGGGIDNNGGVLNLANSNFFVNTPENIAGSFNDEGSNTFH
jgi:hypothetical protein